MKTSESIPGQEGMPPRKQGRVIIIDDDPEILDAFSNLLKLEGYTCEAYTSATAYLETVAARREQPFEPTCVLCDVKMPEVDGLQTQQQLKEQDDFPLILMSGASGAREAISGFRAGAMDFLLKPIDADHLLGVLEKALETSRWRQHESGQRQKLRQLLVRLTPRELEVARLAGRGLTNLAISTELGVTLRDVKQERQRAMEKLAVSGTSDLIRLLEECERNGLLQHPIVAKRSVSAA